jgi:hypothetical protein
MPKTKVRKRKKAPRPVELLPHLYAKHALTVDPGLDFGWASWTTDDWYERTGPVEVGVVKTKAKDDWQKRFQEGHVQLGMLIARVRPGLVLCEWPGFFQSALGDAVAIRGDLGKLYAWVGGLMRVCYAMNCQPELVDVVKWKGQLPKRVVCDRIEERLGDVCSCFSPRTGKDNAGSHDWDAVGIGLWGKGHF